MPDNWEADGSKWGEGPGERRYADYPLNAEPWTDLGMPMTRAQFLEKIKLRPGRRQSNNGDFFNGCP